MYMANTLVIEHGKQLKCLNYNISLLSVIKKRDDNVLVVVLHHLLKQKHPSTKIKIIYRHLFFNIHIYIQLICVYVYIIQI